MPDATHIDATLAGFHGWLETDIDPTDLPASFTWRSDARHVGRSLDTAERELAELEGERQVPLQVRAGGGEHDVVVEVERVSLEGDQLVVALREPAGQAAET